MASEVPLSDLVTIEDHLHNDRVNAGQIADFCNSHQLLVWPGALTDLVATTKTRLGLVQWCYPELIERYQQILTQLKDPRTVSTETLHSWLDATDIRGLNGPLRKSAPAVLIQTIQEQLRLLDERKPSSGESKVGPRRRGCDTNQRKSGRLEHSGTMVKPVRGSPGVSAAMLCLWA